MLQYFKYKCIENAVKHSSRAVFLLLGHYRSFVSCFDKINSVRCWMLLLQYNRYVPDVNSEVTAMFQHQALTKLCLYVNADLFLADRERLYRADCSLRHISCRSSGAAAHPSAAPELITPSGEARRTAYGPAL